MIRAFIATWSGVAGGHVSNPIVEQGGEIVTGAFTCSMYYPDADGDGLPDGPRVLVLVEGGSSTIEDLASLSGVKMLPKYRFNKPVSEIPSTVKQAIKDYVVAQDIAPATIFNSVVVYGDFLKLLVKHFQVAFKSFGIYETLKEKDFE